jgi:O-antigen ligase
VWYSAAAALLVVATAATLSKGGVVSLVAGLFVFVVLNRRVSRGLRVALLAAATLGVVVALALMWHYDFATQAPWLRGRLFLWRAALFILGEHPLTGVGLGG